MGAWDAATNLSTSILAALDSFAWTESAKHCLELVKYLNNTEEPFPEQAARALLEALRRKRQFASLELVADAMVRNGQSNPYIYGQYAQALIDRGSLTAAAMLVQFIIADPRASVAEKAEASGLLGRIYKQQYVAADDPKNPRQQANLIRAIQQYYDIYKVDPTAFYWHGINTVALLARAERDGISISLPLTLDHIANHIEGLLTNRDCSRWESATAVEVAIARGAFAQAYERSIAFLLNRDVDAFEVNSLLSQLIDVWQLSIDQEPGNRLLPAMRAALLKRQGGAVVLAAGEIKAENTGAVQAQTGYEKVFGQDSYQPLAWYRIGLQRCEAVGRVESKTGQRIGTGFIVKAKDFFPRRCENELLFLTNAHVITPPGNPFAEGIPPDAARVVFEANAATYDVREIIWSCPPEKLDSTFVSLKDLSPNTKTCPLTPTPKAFTESGKRLYVIGYPLGAGLSFSLQDSAWLDANEKVLHYRTPTAPGSSGSPVFDQDYWTVIAVHHAGRSSMRRLNGNTGTYEANEGIAIAAILAETRLV